MTSLRERLPAVIAECELRNDYVGYEFLTDPALARALEDAENHARELQAYQTTVENLEAENAALRSENPQAAEFLLAPAMADMTNDEAARVLARAVLLTNAACFLDSDCQTCAEHNEALRLARAALQPWRPIAEAPRDGTAILGHDGDNPATVAWYENPYASYWSLCVTGEYAGGSEWEPTHWMPIPPVAEAKP